MDEFIEKLIPLLEPGDVIIDGGNTHFSETERRTDYVESKGLLYVGTGVSGGEEGALKGPSMMPGGSPKAWPLVKPIFQAIAAKVGPNNDIPCCEWVGPRGAGHYVKMVHNGIEYGDMQLICEAYWMLKKALGLGNDELYDVFAAVVRGRAEQLPDRDHPRHLQREGRLARRLPGRQDPGHGRGEGHGQVDEPVGPRPGRAQHAGDRGGLRPLPVGDEGRPGAGEQAARGPARASTRATATGSSSRFARRCTPRRFAATRRASCRCRRPRPSTTGRWSSAQIALLWRGGCIIRAVFLERIKEAFDADAGPRKPALAPYFKQGRAARPSRPGGTWWPRPCGWAFPRRPSPRRWPITTAIAAERLPANLLQAQRDYFGATPITAWTAKAYSIPIGCGCEGSRREVSNEHLKEVASCIASA